MRAVGASPPGDWIAANLWSTERVRRDPVSLLWDPPGDGEGLGEEEAERHAQAMRRRRDAVVAARLGNPERVVRIAVAPSDDDMRSPAVDAAEDGGGGVIGRPSREAHEGDYLAAVITPLGVRPIRAGEDLQAAHAMRERADRTGEPAMLFGLATAGPEATKGGAAPWVVGERHCFARRVEPVQPEESEVRIVPASCVVRSGRLATRTAASSAGRSRARKRADTR